MRFVTKNILTIAVAEQRTIDWFSQYLIVPLTEPLIVETGEGIAVEFSYPAGASFSALTSTLKVSLTQQADADLYDAMRYTKQATRARVST